MTPLLTGLHPGKEILRSDNTLHGLTKGIGITFAAFAAFLSTEIYISKSFNRYNSLHGDGEKSNQQPAEIFG